MNELDGAAGIKRRGDVMFENVRGFEAQNRANTLSSGEHGVAHGPMDRMWLDGLGGHEAVELCVNRETVFFEEFGKVHRILSLLGVQRGEGVTIGPRLRVQRVPRPFFRPLF